MLHIIYNPVAGHRRAARMRDEVEQRLAAGGAAFRFHETRSGRDARDIARSLTREAREAVDVVAMGGDGTLHEVLNGLADPTATRLGLIPCGGGNDFAAAAGIPADAAGATALLLRGEAKPTDYMVCGGVRGINLIGTGIDVDILRRYNRQRLRGSAGYALALLRALAGFRFCDFDEERGGERIPHSAFIACAGNGQRCGGGITLCPEARIDDGLLDIVIVDGLKKRQIPRGLAKLVQKRLTDLPGTVYRRDSALRVRARAPLPIQIDGEIYEDVPFDVHVVSGELRMFRP